MTLRMTMFSALLGTLSAMAGCALEPPRAVEGRTPRPATIVQPHYQEAGHPAVTFAEQMVGKPYRYGGNTPQGFDCSGLVYYSYSKAGYRLPRDSSGQYGATIHVEPRELRPGDLLFFDIDSKSDHVAIYVGDNRFIHAPSSGKRVSYASLNEAYWRQRFIRAGRVP